MRAMLTFRCFVLVGGLWLAAVSSALAQFRGGAPGGRFDPGMLFDRMANGKATLSINDATGERREAMLQFAKERGITNGQLTREQFIAYVEQRMKGFGGGFRGPGGGPTMGRGFTPGQGPGFAPSPGGPGGNTPPSPETISQWAEVDFKRRDANGDGKLNLDEMPDALKSDLKQWDKDRDSLIELTEYKDYFAARLGGRGMGSEGTPASNPEPNPNAAIIIEEDALDRRPVVFRADKLPKEGLPGWFKELDTDKDGQVALYEWRKGERPVVEFASWDRNDDGFITIDEAMRQHALATRATTPPAAASASPANENRGGERGEGRSKGFGGFSRRRPGS